MLTEDPILLPEIIDHVFLVAVHPASGREYEEAQSVGHSLRLLGEQPLAPTLFRRFANLGRFVAPYGIAIKTVFGRFKDAFVGAQAVHASIVQYRDYQTASIPSARGFPVQSGICSTGVEEA